MTYDSMQLYFKKLSKFINACSCYKLDSYDILKFIL